MFSSSIFLSLKEKNKKNISNNILLYLFTIQEYLFFCAKLYLETTQEQRVQKIGFNKIQIKYNYRGKSYYILSSIPRGPLSKKINIHKICNAEGKDVTGNILPFLGPNFDWHNLSYTPNDFNEDTLKFILDNNETVVRTKHEILEKFSS